MIHAFAKLLDGHNIPPKWLNKGCEKTVFPVVLQTDRRLHVGQLTNIQLRLPCSLEAVCGSINGID